MKTLAWFLIVGFVLVLVGVVGYVCTTAWWVAPVVVGTPLLSGLLTWALMEVQS